MNEDSNPSYGNALDYSAEGDSLSVSLTHSDKVFVLLPIEKTLVKRSPRASFHAAAAVDRARGAN